VVGLRDSPQQAGVAAAIGLVFALWSASGYAGAFIRAANASYDVPEGRPLWKTIPIRIGVTLVTGVLLVASAAIVLVTGTVAGALGRALSLESTTVMVWNVAKWPVLVILVTLMFAMLYWASPNARQGGFRWVSPGGAVAVVLWMIASALFGLYASNFASYDKTYGTLAGVVVFLVWLWITNLALLLGLQLDAELERQRAIAAGLRPDAEPYVRLRDDRAVSAEPESGLADKAVATAAAPPSEPPSEPPAPPQRGRKAAATLGFCAGFAAALVITSRRAR